MLFKFKFVCGDSMRGYKQVANIIDDQPFIKQNPGARARGKKERNSITRYTSLLSKSMLVSYQGDAVPYQRDSKEKVFHRTVVLNQAASAKEGRRQGKCLYVGDLPRDQAPPK
jgi:hypothetical protein